jgi:hypothetical protein
MNRLSQKQNRLMRQLMECKDMVKGSLNAVCATCKRANCMCEASAGNLVFRLTYKDREQQTKIVYVPRGRVSEVRKLIKKFARFRELTDQLIETNIEIFKSGTKP